MTENIIGEVDGLPSVTLIVRTDHDERNVTVYIDTAFDGELAVPESYASWFGPPTDTASAVYADGNEIEQEVGECEVYWCGGFKRVSVMFIDCETPLLGVRLLEGHRLTVEFEKNGEVLIEEI
jgi:predicted aspartyl protease